MDRDTILRALVKPLEWHHFDVWTWWAECPPGTYHVEERNGGWRVQLRVGGLVHDVLATEDTTPEDLAAAQAAAEADYRARIAAALDLDKIAALVEAVEYIASATDTEGYEPGMWAINRARNALAALGEREVGK